MRERSRRALERALGLSTVSWRALDKIAFDNFALALADVPGMRAWTREEKESLIRIIRAKAKPDEMVYLRLTQRHGRLRRLLHGLGS